MEVFRGSFGRRNQSTRSRFNRGRAQQRLRRRRFGVASGVRRRAPGMFPRGFTASGIVRAKFVSTDGQNLAGGGDRFISHFFALNDHPSATNFANIYEEYRIVKAQYSLLPRNNVANLGSPATTGAGGFIIEALDLNDATLWTTLEQAINTQGARRHNILTPWSRFFTPKAVNTITIARGGTAHAANSVAKPWISTAELNVEHYGVKWAAMLGGAASDVIPFQSFTTVWVEFRRRRA